MPHCNFLCTHRPDWGLRYFPHRDKSRARTAGQPSGWGVVWDSWENSLDVCLGHLGKQGLGFCFVLFVLCSCVVFFKMDEIGLYNAVFFYFYNADFEDVKFPGPSSPGLSPCLTAQYTNVSCLVQY